MCRDDSLDSLERLDGPRGGQSASSIVSPAFHTKLCTCLPAYLPTLHYTALHCTTCTCLLHRVSPSTFLPHIARTSVISGPNFRPTAHITISPYSPAYRFLNHLVRPPSLPIPALATIPVCLDRCNQSATCCFFLLFHPSSPRGSSPTGLNPRLGGCQCLLPARLASSPCSPCPALQPIASIRTKGVIAFRYEYRVYSDERRQQTQGGTIPTQGPTLCITRIGPAYADATPCESRPV